MTGISPTQTTAPTRFDAGSAGDGQSATSPSQIPDVPTGEQSPSLSGGPDAKKPEGSIPAEEGEGTPSLPDAGPDVEEVAPPPEPEPPSYINSPEEDLLGVPGYIGGPQSAPTLPMPVVDTAKMMMALASLQQKMTDESLKLGEEAIKSSRKDVEDLNKRRAQELENYWNNMAKSRARKSMGLFGVIANFFKKLFSGDIGGAFKTLVDNIGPALSDLGKLIAGALAVVFAAGASVLSAGAGSAALGLAIAGMAIMMAGMVMGDPGIQEMILESLPEDQRQAAIWALFSVALALQVAGSILQCCANPSGLTQLGKAVRDVTAAVTNIVQGAVTISSGVDAKKATDARAAAVENQAQMDHTKALISKLQAIQSRDMNDFKGILDAFASILSSTAAMMSSYGQGFRAAASV